jgi:alpha-tubulin suppressor-like RCC1 family protein
MRRRTSGCHSRFSRLFLTAATLLPIACKETTTPAGPPAKLVFTVQPVTTTAIAVIPTFQVAVQNAAGNTVENATNSVSLGIATNQGNGAILTGPTTVSAVNGVATFSNLAISKAASGYALLATATSLFSGVSGSFDVNAGPASKLVFTQQPALAVSGATIPQVKVTILDAVDNTVTTSTTNITVAIGTNPGSGTLSGTTSVTPVDGVATFSNLSINNAGAGYTLTATAGSLALATSTAFTIRVPLVFSVVSAGYFHTCGVTTGGAAYCWGDNSTYQLGNPGVSFSTLPLQVSGGLTFAKVVAGRDHTCGVNASGVAYCWGSNAQGRLGTGTGSNTTPAPVSGTLTFATTSAAYAHTCGVTTNGEGYCWGDNSAGALGSGSTTATGFPGAIAGGLSFASISPGRYFTCGRTTAGAAYCWGDNTDGELGDGTQTRSTSPVAVSGAYNFASVSAGGFHTCGLTTAGVAYCWGSNGIGQLGDGTLNSSSIPKAVSGTVTFASISAGNRHTCAVTAAGAAYCWGDNSGGALGTGSNINGSLVPIAVSGGLTFANVSAGRFHTCGVTTGGTAYCWGTGVIGDGSTAGSNAPVAVR